MIDDDDVSWMAVLWPDGGGWPLAMIGVVAILVMAAVSFSNHLNCETKHCERGAPVLMEHECLCMEKAQ